jgi:hypothetical protein
MLTFSVLMVVVVLIAGAPPRRRTYMVKAAVAAAIGYALADIVITQPGLVLVLLMGAAVLAAIALVLYLLHRIVRSHNTHVQVLEQNRHRSAFAYIRWLLNP